MNILVIGSEGFIGKHIMEQGRAIGHTMTGADVYGSPDLPYHSDLIDNVSQYDRVIHSAGVLGTQETFSYPERAVIQNVNGTLHMLDVCRKSHTHFTYITLGNNWLNPYSISKNCASEFVRMFNTVHNTPTQVAIAYNLFGPYQKWKPVRKIVPEFMTRILSGRPVELFFNGEAKVDMVYAPDVALSILGNMDTGTAHYGTGEAMSVSSVLDACEKALGMTAARVDAGPRPGETDAAAIAPYPMPIVTPLESAMKTTAEWYREHLA